MEEEELRDLALVYCHTWSSLSCLLCPYMEKLKIYSITCCGCWQLKALPSPHARERKKCKQQDYSSIEEFKNSLLNSTILLLKKIQILILLLYHNIPFSSHFRCKSVSCKVKKNETKMLTLEYIYVFGKTLQENSLLFNSKILNFF